MTCLTHILRMTNTSSASIAYKVRMICVCSAQHFFFPANTCVCDACRSYSGLTQLMLTSCWTRFRRTPKEFPIYYEGGCFRCFPYQCRFHRVNNLVLMGSQKHGSTITSAAVVPLMLIPLFMVLSVPWIFGKYEICAFVTNYK